MEFMNYLQKLPPFSNQNFLNEINLDPPQYLPSITDTVLKILDSENSSYCSANENQLQSPPIYRNFRPPPPPYRPATEKPPPPPYKITQSWIDNCNTFKQYIPGDQEIDIYNDDWASEIQNSDFFSSETESDFYGSRSETPSPHVTAKRSDFVQELFPPSKRRCFSPEDSGWNSENSTTKQLPRDLVEWKEEHVSLWLKWFLRSFYDHKPNLSRIPNNGVELDKLNLADLINITGDWKVANMLWDDLIPYKKETFEYEGEISNENESSRLSPEHKNTIKDRILQTFVAEKKNAKNDNTGQFQLWQFLLDLLSKREHSDKIEWEGEDGTFKLKLPDEVAKMWGKKKKKEGMTYEKLSRSLRYYYDKQIMSKVNGKRFSYKFDLDGLTRAYHPTGVSDSCFIQADDLNCPPRNFPLTSYMQRDIQKSVSPSSSI